MRGGSPHPLPPPLLIYGGTFDPVHEGHVAIARHSLDALGLDQAALVPCGDPPHRERPVATGAQRAEMLRRAFGHDPRFRVDERELRRDGPCYTIDTLEELRADLGREQPLVLLLGADAFRGLPTWHRWREVPRLAHLAVFARPGITLDPAASDWPEAVHAPVDDPAVLRERAAGCCVLLPVALSGHSSTAIRAGFAAGQTRPDGLPAAVADWLLQVGNPYRG